MILPQSLRWSRALPVAAALALVSTAGNAQRSVRVRADNDAFNFWQAPWNRPDEEYTSGVRLTVEYAGDAWWSGRGSKSECKGTDGQCATHSYALGQDIYTAVRSRAHPTPAAGARPDAGVLWIAAVNSRWRRGTGTELEWKVGTTGKPALAAPLQRFFHDIAPGWNGPIDWTSQLPAEPVFAVSLDQRRQRDIGAVAFLPHAGASLGNLLTEARVGLGARVGRDPRRRGPSAGNGISWALTSAVTVRGVVRNEALSGTFFRPSAHVTPRPVVTELRAGVHLRWRGIGLAWNAHQTSSEYTTRSGAHAWSTLEAGWWPGR